MFDTILGALLPAIVTVLFGYLAARTHEFGRKDAPVLNRMVITFALPLAIFTDTVGTSRQGLIGDIPMLIVLVVAIVGTYGSVFWVCRSLFHFSVGTSALGALAASAPNGPFVGAAVLGSLFGSASDLPVAISGIVIYVTVAPLTVVLLSLDGGKRSVQPEGRVAVSVGAPAAPAAPTAATAAAPDRTEVKDKIVAALREPVVWFPVLGVVIVLSGLRVPALIDKSLDLLGSSATGVALFTAGVVLAGYRVMISRAVAFFVLVKNVVQPLLVWVSLVLLSYSKPHLSQAVVMTALPSLVLVVMLSVQYGVAETEAASTLLVSMLASLLTISAFILLTGSA
ncbi:MAG: transport protein [Actinomycetia bacterium]|nr:transport protein [Actinomycetes bacterium]